MPLPLFFSVKKYYNTSIKGRLPLRKEIESYGKMAEKVTGTDRSCGSRRIAGAAAGILFYFKKRECGDAEDGEDVFEDEDFDLDSDLKSADREYVPLNAGKTEEASGEASEKSEDAAPEDSSDSDKE